MSDWKSGGDGGFKDSGGGFTDMGGGDKGFGVQGGGDTFTETTYQSWGSRIANSLVGVLIGIVLIPLSCWLLFWNEGRAVTTARSLAEGASAIVSVATDRVDTANNDRLVYLTGQLRAADSLSDPVFPVRVQNAVRLVRTVEMYQWRENSRSETRDRMGGGRETVTTYSYERVWSSTLYDSSRFRQSGHDNPRTMAQRSNTVTAPQATVGAFRLTPEQMQSYGRPVPAEVDPNNAEIQRHNATVQGSTIYLNNPNSPRIGDLRVSFTYVPAGEVSMIGRQDGERIAPYQTRAGDRIFMMEAGRVPARDMFRHAEEGNTIFTWILRAVGMILLMVGFSMIMGPLGALAAVLPMLGDIVRFGTGLIAMALSFLVGPLVIAIAWFWFRPIVALAVIGVGVLVALGLSALARNRAQARMAAQAMRPPMPPPQQPMQGWGR